MTSYLVYSDTEPKSPFSGLSGINPNTAWRNHLENWYFLKLTLKNGTMIERHQASKELEICERKLSFWEKKPTFNRHDAEQAIKSAKLRWESEDRPK